uniref:Complement factor D n=1 Tax=Crocodylus porosus TaxID=8502 RepID=A0A7M4F9D8_CROPO
MARPAALLAPALLLGALLCGESRAPRGRILGGSSAGPHQRPYMASLQVDGQHVCGGLLIAEQWVLSAAHCMEDMKGKAFQVLLGAHSLSQPEPHKRLYAVRAAVRHPGSNTETNDDDLLLLQLEEKATLSEHVKILPFQRQDVDVPPGTLCEAAGWGFTSHSGRKPDVLQQVERLHPGCFGHRAPQLGASSWCPGCVGSPPGGDSGGPLICNGVAEGVVTAGARVCGNFKKPGIYTRIAAYVDWIDGVMAAAGEGSASPSP